MNIKQKLAAGKLVVGGWLQVAHPSVAEAIRSCSLDFLTVDAEHGDCDLSAIANTLRGMGDIPGFVRVRENDTLAIRQALDCDARGIFVPMVETAEGSAHAVAAAKYPPKGIRGFAYCRANGWGNEFDMYTAAANEQITVIVMIESATAIDNIDAILSVDGVDGVFIGPYDLSGSLGVIGQLDHPKLLEAQKHMLDACRRHSKAAGIHLVQPDTKSTASVIEQGFSLIAIGMDTVFLANGMKNALSMLQRHIG